MTDNYLTHLQAQNYSNRTIKEYNAYNKRTIIELEKRGVELDQELIEGMVSHFNNGVFRAFLKDYLDWKELPFKIPKSKGRTPKKIKEYIPPEDVKRLRKILWKKQDRKYYLMIRLTYECALRKNEVVNISAEDFDWEKWKSSGKKDYCDLIIRKGKGGKQRKTIISPALALRIWNYGLRNSERILSQKNMLFGISGRRWQQVFNESVKQITTKKYTLHGLRFSRATYWHNEKGFDILTIKKLLGHESISTTQLYIDPEMDSALDKLKGGD